MKPGLLGKTFPARPVSATKKCFLELEVPGTPERLRITCGRWRLVRQHCGDFGPHCRPIWRVDLDKGIISVRRAAWEGTEQTPETPNAVRKIGIDAEVVRILREQLGNRRYGYVFQARNGNPLRESNILRRHLHPVLKKLKIPICGLHAFRHGRVSFLVENNVPVPMIRLWIGHGSDKMVQRYTHARPEFHANVIASLPSIANGANMKTEAA